MGGFDSIRRWIFRKKPARAIPLDNTWEPIMNMIVNRRDLLSATATAGICGAGVGNASADPKAKINVAAGHPNSLQPMPRRRSKHKTGMRAR